jgi:hypothetical protein
MSARTLRELEEEHAAAIAAVNAYYEARKAQVRERPRRAVVRPAARADDDGPVDELAERRASEILARHGRR